MLPQCTANIAIMHHHAWYKQVYSYWDKSVIQNKQQQNNTTTINFFKKRVKKNSEDTAEKALVQYWDDVERSTLVTTKERRVRASAHFLCTSCNQEALIVQTDCTTRYINQNLVNCCTIAGTRSTTNPYEIEVMQLEHCGRRTCS